MMPGGRIGPLPGSDRAEVAEATTERAAAAHDIRAMWDADDIAAYLHFGYLPCVAAFHAAAMPWHCFWRDSAVASMSRAGLLDRGVESFRAAVGAVEERRHVVPLSGGLDSRAILAELLRQTSARNITAITVGTPGSFDFDLAARVADLAGVQHVRIDLTRVPLEDGRLEQTARSNSSPTWIFDAFYNRLMRERLGPEALYWSGYLGSRITSNKHLPTPPPESWPNALTVFASTNRWDRSTELTSLGFDPAGVLPSSPLHPESHLSAYEQLDLTIRQERLVKPVNLPAGFEHRAPFREWPWIQYALSLPLRERDQQSAYRAMLLKAYPRLFGLPTTTRLGLPLRPSGLQLLRWRMAGLSRGTRRRLLRHPQTWARTLNYIDFGVDLRRRRDLRELAERRLRRLVEREVAPWLAIDRLWRAHLTGHVDHSRALTLLVSLEIHLTASEEATTA